MPGRSVTANHSGPMRLLRGLAFVLLASGPASMATAQSGRSSPSPVALPPLERIPVERVRDHDVHRTASGEDEESAPESLPALPGTSVTRAGDASTLRADAGDDQIGLVGRQLTLNGSRSQPKGGLGFRWILMSGPRADPMVEDGHFLAFTPTVSGVYRFALVVASGSRISEPDVVEVIVGALTPVNAPGPPAQGAPTLPALSTEELARRSLASIAGGREAGEGLAETFDAIASKMDLYQTYADVFSELSRRLEGTLSTDPAQRAAWTQGLFMPLSARLVEQLRTVGLDLSQAAGAGQPLTPAQKERLAEQFQRMAEGFRESKPAQ